MCTLVTGRVRKWVHTRLHIVLGPALSFRSHAASFLEILSARSLLYFQKKSARPNVEFQVRHFGGVVVFGVVFGSCVQEAAEFWVWRVFECNFRGKSTVLSGRRRHHKPRAQRAAE